MVTHLLTCVGLEVHREGPLPSGAVRAVRARERFLSANKVENFGCKMSPKQSSQIFWYKIQKTSIKTILFIVKKIKALLDRYTKFQ